jgi:hypothetical protein
VHVPIIVIAMHRAFDVRGGRVRAANAAVPASAAVIVHAQATAWPQAGVSRVNRPLTGHDGDRGQ